MDKNMKQVYGEMEGLSQILEEMEELSNQFFANAEQFVESQKEIPRYYEDASRSLQHEIAKERGHVFTIEQIRDVMQLVKSGKSPNADYSDDECNLWKLLKYGC